MFKDQTVAEKATKETVTEIIWWSNKLLTFKTTKPPNYSFIAGQYARLGLENGDGAIWRAYSMTSAPGEDLLEFYGIIVPEGRFTARLKEIKEGDSLLVDKQSFGFMTPDRFTDGEDLWLLATGTGIGPYISMLRDPYVWQKFRNIVLVHCVRHADEFAYIDQLKILQENAQTSTSARLRVLRSTTRETAGASSTQQLYGRITTLFENGDLEKTAGLSLNPESSRVMLCGNPDMIEAMRQILHRRGMRPDRRANPGHFVTENYW